MARPRVYRRQARCPECGSNWMPKDGHSKGRQVYQCGDALYPGTVPGRRNRGGGDGHNEPALAGHNAGGIRQAPASYGEGCQHGAGFAAVNAGFGAPLGGQAAHCLIDGVVKAEQIADYPAVQRRAVGVGVG